MILVGRRRSPEGADLPHSEVAGGRGSGARGEPDELAAILHRAREAGIDCYRVLAALGFDLSSLESSAQRDTGATARRPPL